MPVSKTERLARDLMAHYRPDLKPAFNVRPKWLRNPETGQSFEIDIFYGDIQAGVEVQGAQHGIPIDGLQGKYEPVAQSFWGRLTKAATKYRLIEGSSQAGFEKQQRHDMLKIERCKEWGVRLYHLTIHDLTRRRFEAFIKRFKEENRLTPSRYISPPLALFAEAERLSRRRVVRTKFVDTDYALQDSKPSIWQRVWRWLNT